MLTLSLGFGIASSDAKDWTNVRKALAITWLAVIDITMLAFCINF